MIYSLLLHLYRVTSIYLLSLSLSIVKSFSGRKNLWRDFGVHRDIVIIEHSTT